MIGTFTQLISFVLFLFTETASPNQLKREVQNKLGLFAIQADISIFTCIHKTRKCCMQSLFLV